MLVDWLLVEQEFPEDWHGTSQPGSSHQRQPSKMVADMFKIVDSAYGKVKIILSINIEIFLLHTDRGQDPARLQAGRCPHYPGA